MAQPDENDGLRLFSALEYLRRMPERNERGVHAASLPASRLCDYARRGDSVADLAIERLLRGNSRARAVYAGAMKRMSSAYSPMAAAAGAGDVRTRVVGPHRIEVIDEQDMAYLVVHLGDATAPVEWIEVRTREGGGARVQLGKAIRNIVQLPLDHRNPELKAVDEAIRRPDCQIYLGP